MRRILVGFLALMPLAVFVPTAAVAQDSVNVSIGGVSDGQTVRGGVTVSASASAGTGVDSLTLTIANYVAASTEPSGVQNNASVSYPWNTRQLPNSSTFTRNGSYAISARARSNGGNVQEVTINVVVDNDATAPTGVNASANNEGVVRITWNRNPEPDISAYKVERDGASIGETQDTSFTDQANPGSYSYRVIALRGGYATPSNSVSVTVDSPPPPPEPDPEQSPYEEPNPSDEPYYQDHPQSAGGDAQQDPNGYGQFPSGGEGGDCYDCDSGCYSCGGYGGPGGSDVNDRLSGGADDFATKGLPGAIFAPGFGSAGLPALPGVPRPPAVYPLEWGTYEENLPYDLSAGRDIIVPGDRTGLISRTIRTIIPPDGLRWVAVGILMLVSAGMMRTIGSRVAPPAKTS